MHLARKFQAIFIKYKMLCKCNFIYGNCCRIYAAACTLKQQQKQQRRKRAFSEMSAGSQEQQKKQAVHFEMKSLNEIT